MQSLIPLLTTILSSHREWFKTKGNSGVFADLSKENLEEGNFKNSDLRGANFHDACLTKTQFQNCNLEESDLMWVDLRGAILENANLKNAYLHEADLRETNITKDQIKFAYTDEDTLLPNCISNKEKT